MPKRVDQQARRQQIAEAAVSVIGRMGMEGVRLRDVAREAEVTTGAVAHYFEDKEAVLCAALERIVAQTLERMEKAGPRPSPEDLDGFVRRVSRYLPLDERTREEWRVWLAFWGRAIANEKLRAIYRRHYAAIIERLAAFLRAMNPDAPESAVICATDALMGAIDGVGVRATLEPEEWPKARQRRTLAQALRPLLEDFLSAGRGARGDEREGARE